MSDRINKFCASLQNHLNSLEERALALKSSVQAAPRQAEEALRQRLGQAERKVESQKQAVAKAKMTMQNWFDQKTAAAQAAVAEWRTNHEAKKLALRADKAEEHAAAAILLAQATIDEADHALLEAIAARIDADSVAGA